MHVRLQLATPRNLGTCVSSKALELTMAPGRRKSATARPETRQAGVPSGKPFALAGKHGCSDVVTSWTFVHRHLLDYAGVANSSGHPPEPVRCIASFLVPLGTSAPLYVAYIHGDPALET